MRGRDILVTGATGFVGRRLAERLVADGAAVSALVRATSDTRALAALNVELVVGDLASRESVERAVRKDQIVFNCAAGTARSARKRQAYDAANVAGLEHLMQACRAAGAGRIVHCSTTGVHGPLRRTPIDEDAPLRPNSLYRRTKLAGEGIVMRYAGRGVDATIARLTTLYGPGSMQWLPLCRDIHQGRALLVGKGDQPFHISHVDDVVDGLLKCATTPAATGRTYFIGSDTIPTLAGWFETLADALGAPFNPRRIPATPVRCMAMAGALMSRVTGVEPRWWHSADFYLARRTYRLDRAKAELGFRPSVNLADGVRSMIAWYKQAGLLADAPGEARRVAPPSPAASAQTPSTTGGTP